MHIFNRKEDDARIVLRVKAISVDFWDTISLYPFTQEIFEERVSHSYGIFRKYDVSEGTSRMLMRSVYDHFEDIWHNHRRTPTTPEMFRHIEKLVGYELRSDDFNTLVEFNEKLITEKYFKIESGIEKALRKLSGKYKLVIISDTGFEPGREIRNALKKLNMLDIFSYAVFSDETGYSKPDIRAFFLAAEKAGCRTDEMVHIGDRESKDISGARDSGMKAILYTGFRSEDEKDTTADVTVSSWEEILNLLD